MPIRPDGGGIQGPRGRAHGDAEVNKAIGGGPRRQGAGDVLRPGHAEDAGRGDEAVGAGMNGGWHDGVRSNEDAGKKEPRLVGGVQIGDDILSLAFGQVPSALVSLTSLFGMGRGGPHRNSHLKSCVRFQLDVRPDQNSR